MWYSIRDVALLFITGRMDNDVRRGSGRLFSPFPKYLFLREKMWKKDILVEAIINITKRDKKSSWKKILRKIKEK